MHAEPPYLRQKPHSTVNWLFNQTNQYTVLPPPPHTQAWLWGQPPRYPLMIETHDRSSSSNAAFGNSYSLSHGSSSSTPLPSH